MPKNKHYAEKNRSAFPQTNLGQAQMPDNLKQVKWLVINLTHGQEWLMNLLM